ncbi:MAG: BrnA antitoxin family protein [Sideroxydans sp.]|nr:BrnA antitoxin family protein [Sideroxydans sp.]
MPKLKHRTILPTPEEDAIITAAAMADPDAIPLTDAEWAAVQPQLRRGRPIAAQTKIHTGLRLDAEVVAAFKAGGRGWQTRMNDALKDWLKTHHTA